MKDSVGTRLFPPVGGHGVWEARIHSRRVNAVEIYRLLDQLLGLEDPLAVSLGPFQPHPRHHVIVPKATRNLLEISPGGILRGILIFIYSL
jgi:hypothetical protein